MEYRFTIIDGETEIEIDEPIGWDRCKFTLVRDDNYHGIFTMYSTDLEFVGNGYTYISETFYNKGIEYFLQLKIEERCNSSYEYSTQLITRINLSRFKDLFNVYCSCKVNLEDTSSQMLIKNNADKLVNLSESLSVSDAELQPVTINEMTMHSKAIVLTTVFKDAILLNQSINMDDIDNQAIAIPLWLLVDSDDLNSAISSTNFFWSRNTSSYPTWWTNVTQFRANYSGVYEIDYNIVSQTKFTVSARDFEMNIAIALYKNGNLVQDLTDIVSREEYIITEETYTDNWNTNGTVSITLDEDDYVSIFYRVRFIFLSGVGSGVVDWEHYSSVQDVTFKSNTETASSNANTFLIHECYERVSQSVLNKKDAFKSNYFGRKNLGYGSNGLGSFTALTNGFNIRSFNKPVLLKLSELFNSTSSVNCLGLGIEQDETDNEYIRVEPLEYFYDGDREITSMLNIANISVDSNENLIFNTCEIGFDKYGTEEGTDKQNTLDGFATRHTYNFPITTVKKVFTKISNYIADHYAIEFTRRVQYLTTSTNQWKFDDDIFFICTNRSEDENGIAISLNIAEKNENFEVTNNILAPETGYNLRLTPARMMLLWNKFFSGVYSKSVGNSVKFSNGISNYLYQSKMNGNTNDRYNNQLLEENQNIAWDDENNSNNLPITEPISIKYTYPTSLELFNTIKSNPKGYISCSKSSTIEHRGFIKMITFTPNDGTAEYELIRLFGNEPQCNLKYVECPYVVPEYVE
jgi:hypothetical protein